MKKFICIVCVCLILVFSLCGCTTNDTFINHCDTAIDEWISPDGVHYWYYNKGYIGLLAPRYDSNGELVID